MGSDRSSLHDAHKKYIMEWEIAAARVNYYVDGGKQMSMRKRVE
jgi:hypothetical protein